MIGSTLHHYRIVGLLGAGGMGEVYAAEDTKLRRRVALKLLPPEMAADPDRLQRFQLEARAIAALNHPNVVTIYAVEEADGVQFLTMELVEGKTLVEIIPKQGLPVDQLLALAIPLVDAVAAAHQQGIVHRDLKPANIMVASNGTLKVLDFGLAKLKREIAATDSTLLTSPSLTARHAIIGTAAYMSPEQAQGLSIDHRSDIFSLGVVLYEMACGSRPFSGDTTFSLISSIIKDTPPHLSAVNRDIPRELDRIVARALAKDPALRYQSALDLRADLEALQHETPTHRWISRVLGALVRLRLARTVALVSLLLAGTAAAAYLLLGWGREGSRARPAPVRATFRRLSAQPGVEQYPSLLPDGKWVVYSGEESGNRDIYLLSTTGQNPINLTADCQADDDEPAASPDGERIAFRSGREGGGIFVMGRTGEGVRRVTRTGVSTAFNPTWSPDGDRDRVHHEDVQLTPLNWECQSELWVVNVGTGAQRKLAVTTRYRRAGRRTASESPTSPAAAEGQTPCRRRRPPAGSWTSGRVPARGGEPVPRHAATRRPTGARCGRPTERHLYFVSDRGGSMNLWRVPDRRRVGQAARRAGADHHAGAVPRASHDLGRRPADRLRRGGGDLEHPAARARPGDAHVQRRADLGDHRLATVGQPGPDARRRVGGVLLPGPARRAMSTSSGPTAPGFGN